MPTIEFPSLADHVRTLPATGAGRDRQLRRIINLCAATEAAAALQAAAERKGHDTGALASALNAAAAIHGAAVTDQDLRADDPARDRLRNAVTSAEFLALIPGWVRELREVASSHPDTGACTVATALELWSWTVDHASKPDAVDELAEALCPLLAARYATIEVRGNDEALRRDLSHVYAAHAAASAGAVCAEVVFGYRRHLTWDAEGCASCYQADQLDELEGFMPGMSSGARSRGDVVESDGSHEAKEGPCARFNGLDRFVQLRSKLDGCLTGARIARERAATAIAASIANVTPSKKSKGRA